MEKRIKNKRTFPGTKNPAVSERETAHRQTAREAAQEGFVLLKNEGMLPIPKGGKIALYGRGVSRTVKGGTGSGDVNERKSISIYEGMKQTGFEIVTEDWIRDYDSAYEEARKKWRDEILEKSAGEKHKFFDIYAETVFDAPAGKAVEKLDTDTAVYVISRIAGEAADRKNIPGDYLLSEEENRMISDICAVYPKVLVVLNTGGVIDLSFLDSMENENIKAVLQISQPGMAGGEAFVDCLTGEVTPSGKLTDTWAYHYEDYPGAENFSHNNGNVEEEIYEEGIFVGYRYFDSFEIPVRYGFGYGLSYTTFETSLQKTGWEETEGKSEPAVTVSVKNTGEYAGKEVVQIYVSCPQGKLPKEHRRLSAFAKTRLLKPGEEQEITLRIPLYGLSSYDEERGAYILEPGYYGIWLGNSLQDSRLCAGLCLEQEAVLVKTDHICPPPQKLVEMRQDGETAQKYAEREQELLEKELPVLRIQPEQFVTETIAYTDTMPEAMQEAEAFVKELTTEQCIKLVVGDPALGQDGELGAAGASTPGSAGETSHCVEEKGLAGITLADGPAGLRLMKYYHVHEEKVVPMPFEFCLEGGLFYDESTEIPGERYYQYCTAIPVGTALAQTWNEELIEKTGAMIGREMDEFGVTLWLAPGMNIHRNPLCGRNFEYYSEDPLLSGKMAAAMTKGVQSMAGCGTTIKHFACNNLEDNRKHCNSILSERAFREIYLKGFEIAVKEAQPMSIMTSYNLINGVHAANCYDTCTKAARDEWGFGGMIMTDWTTTHDDPLCTAAGCMRAGNDLIMPGEASDYENIREELKSGTLPEARLRECAARIVHTIFRSKWYI